MACHLGLDDVVRLLQDTLHELAQGDTAHRPTRQRPQPQHHTNRDNSDILSSNP